jgi:lipopolysaccharide export system protein LptA
LPTLSSAQKKSDNVGAEKLSKDSVKRGSLLDSVNKSDPNEPTYISSNALQVDSAGRAFVYTGNVTVKRGDMTLTSDILEGTYTEQNEIDRLVARSNVKIIKGENIEATSNKAVYDAKTEIVTLTENPEIHQEKSSLTADVVKVYLQESRSEAEGQVRVKLNKVTEKPKN